MRNTPFALDVSQMVSAVPSYTVKEKENHLEENFTLDGCSFNSLNIILKYSEKTFLAINIITEKLKGHVYLSKGFL